MNRISKRITFFVLLVVSGLLVVGLTVPACVAAMPGFDLSKMSDMSDFNPNDDIEPSGDVVKIGYLNHFSGAGAGNGEVHIIQLNWVVHDLNKRGGIVVDGKKKLIRIIKGDVKGQPAVAKKAAERLCLEDKVDVLSGVSGSHLALVVQNVAKKYKKIYHNDCGVSDSLLNAKNFNRYAFRTCITTSMFGQAMAYYYAQRPEKKFFILCQDYMYGHDIANAFKRGLKKYKKDYEIVGEEYHPLFLKDFAPYLTKVQGADAEVIYTGDWLPDGMNMVMQAHNLGIRLPVANLYADTYEGLKAIGGEAGRKMVNGNAHMITVDTPENKAFNKMWNDLWQKWDKPYNSPLYKWPISIFGECVNGFYWMFDVIERAGTTDPEKIISVWEGDEYRSITGVVKMRACDHQIIRDVFVAEFEYPNPWFDDAASYGKPFIVPAKYC